ncbi:MAG: HDOD domain-containing protein [Burkholderiales bacterium]|nr:HDOD domain-containing protein [Burkholderiales bacterium]
MKANSELRIETEGELHDKPNQRVVSLLIQLAKQNADASELARVLRTDPVLCYALLTDLGSSGAVPREYVTSCRQAVELTGMSFLMQWLEAALVYAVPVTKLSNSMRDALIRARFMELIGRSMMQRDAKDTEDLYLVGLFSKLNTLVDMDLAELILPLPFPEDMRAAILDERGRMGRLLKFAQTIESADETGIDFMQTNMRLPSARVYEAYNEAYDWMLETEKKLTSTA